MEYPLRKINKEKIDKLFKELGQVEEIKPLCRRYNDISNYYFQYHRLSTRKNSKPSVIEAYKDPEKRDKIIFIMEKYKLKINDANIRESFRFYYGMVGQFRPDVAMYIYKRFNATNVLDFSAGWGDRCIAAIRQDIYYTGIDTNESLREPYENMIKDFNGNKAKIIFEKSENCINSLEDNYDLVFTSPPYYNIEKYNGMPEYKNYEDFVKTFFIPCVTSSWNKLKINGHMVLNIPKNMYESIAPVLGHGEEIKMRIASRFSDGEHRYEIIYFWKKSN